jgi:hypothetical protein
MIRTRFGENVRIVSVNVDGSLVCESLKDPRWRCSRYPHELRADGGIPEITTEIERLLPAASAPPRVTHDALGALGRRLYDLWRILLTAIRGGR